MGECFISRRGGEAYKLPVLNADYPQDVKVRASANGIATFKIEISEQGRPTEYTYQWYVNGSAISGATNSVYTHQTTSIGEYTLYCDITNKAGTVSSRLATLEVATYLPNADTFSYDGLYEIKDEGNYNWNIRLLESGNATFTEDTLVDIFLVGGGGAGGGSTSDYDHAGGGGGGGGYVATHTGLTAVANTEYLATIGSGGTAKSNSSGGTGGSTSFMDKTVSGGSGGKTSSSRTGGAGGSGGGAGGKGVSDGSGGTNGGAGGYNGSKGNAAGGASGGAGSSVSNTYEFGESSRKTLYAGGGGGGGGGWVIDWEQQEWFNGGAGGSGGGGKGGKHEYNGTSTGTGGTSNTGGGGGGAGGRNSGTAAGGAGGSGIVIIRNAR